MEASMARIFAHLIVLLWCIYLALDARAAGRTTHAWIWAAFAAERLSILALLVIDTTYMGLWVEWRPALAPFIVLVAIALSVYGVQRIRTHRAMRRVIHATSKAR